jgi:acyl transferase domain-containing protein
MTLLHHRFADLLTVPWEELNVKVVTKPTAFPSNLPCRRVGVSAFGYGGTNGHAILESTNSFLPEYCGYRRPMEIEQTGSHMHRRIEGQAHLLLLSAHDQPTLLKTTKSIERYCNSTNVFDLAYTLATRREEHPTRTFAVCHEANCSSRSEFPAENIVTSAATTHVAFAFTGQ